MISSIKLCPQEIQDLPAFDMVEILGGSFFISEETEVELRPFLMGQYLVTQELWKKVMRNNPSRFKGESLPIERVSWYDCVEFCNKLSEQAGLDPAYEIDKKSTDSGNKSSRDKLKWKVRVNHEANGFRLPTEAEWEYAARGGEYSQGYTYAGSEELDEVGWYRENSQGQTRAVGLKAPNELGLYDMSGNVWEWCWDWYDSYPSKKLKNPVGPESGFNRVCRGGCWGNAASVCRVAYRSLNWPDYRSYDLGFRLSRTAL